MGKPADRNIPNNPQVPLEKNIFLPPPPKHGILRKVEPARVYPYLQNFCTLAPKTNSNNSKLKKGIDKMEQLANNLISETTKSASSTLSNSLISNLSSDGINTETGEVIFPEGKISVFFDNRIIEIDESTLSVCRIYQMVIEDASLFSFWTELIYPDEVITNSNLKRSIHVLGETIKETPIVSTKAVLITRKKEIEQRVTNSEKKWVGELLTFFNLLNNEIGRRGNPTAPLIPDIADSVISIVSDDELSPGETFLGSSWRTQTVETIWKAIINAELIGGALSAIDVSKITGIDISSVLKIQSNAAFGYFKVRATESLPRIGVETQRGREIALRLRYNSIMAIIFERKVAASSPEEISDSEISRAGLTPEMRDPQLRLVPGARTGMIWYKVISVRVSSEGSDNRGSRTTQIREYFYDSALELQLKAIEKQLAEFEERTILRAVSGNSKATKKNYNFDARQLISANTPIN